MDLLSDILQQAGLQRRLLGYSQLDGSTALRFPCEKSMGLHVVTRGQIYLTAPSLKEAVVLRAGDMAVMARGCDHVLNTQPVVNATRLMSLVDAGAAQPVAPMRPEDVQGAVISGAYQFWHTPVHPFFSQVPDWFVVRSDGLPRLGPLALTVSLLEEELSKSQLGAGTIVHALLDVVFTYLLREMVGQLGEQGCGWSHAIEDAQVRKAVALMHGDCARPWTLQDLASSAGLSRTGLAERFRTSMGDTPLNYLRTLRMQKAMRILSETSKALEHVAQEVGYFDAFSFSKVFKRTVGMAPREFRRQDGHDKSLSWRFSH